MNDHPSRVTWRHPYRLVAVILVLLAVWVAVIAALAKEM